MQIEALFIYPIKSTQGVRISAMQFDHLGPAHDRRWMLIDGAGCFLTQRDLPALGRVQATPLDSGLLVRLGGADASLIPFPGFSSGSISCQIWRDGVRCRDAGDEAAELFSRFLGQQVRLVYAGEGYERPVRPDFALSGEQVGLADGFPLLVLTTTALDELGVRLGSGVDAARFRANVLISDAPAHAEDRWRRIQIGGVKLRLVRPCARCQIPALDPQTGVTTPGFNRTLASYRRLDGQIYFGQNALLEAQTTTPIAEGDHVEVLEIGAPRPDFGGIA